MRTLRIALVVMLLFVAFLAASCGPATRGTSVAPGQLAWKFRAGDNAGEAAISGGLVYVAGNDGKQPEDKRFAASLHALDAASGTERWKFTMPHDEVETAPAVSGGLVYVGTLHSYVYALDAATGTQRWKQQIGLQVVLSSPAVSGGLVYVAGTGESGGDYICALDAATGAERCKVNVGDTLDSVAVSGGLVYVGSMDGYVCALDAATGTQRWKFTQASVYSMVVFGGLVYVAGLDGYVYAVTTGTAALMNTGTSVPSTDSTLAR